MNKGSNIGIELNNPTYMSEWTYVFIPSVIGFSSLLQRELWYNIVGKTVYFVIRIVGTSNSGVFRFTLPNNLPIKLYDSNANYYLITAVNNNNRILTARADFGKTTTTSDTFGVTCYTSPAGAIWGTNNTKGINISGFFETN